MTGNEICPVEPDNTVFIPYKDGIEAKIVEIIDEDFVVIQFSGVEVIYSTKLEKFNATKYVSAISESKYNNWHRSKSAACFRHKFPKFFKEILTNQDAICKDFNRIKGTYLDLSLLPIITAWCNPMRAYCLVNDIREEFVNDTQGYIYIVQPEEYLGTDIYKIGRTWSPKQRFREYGEKHKVIECKRVTNMYKCEQMILSNLNESDDYKLVRGKEYFEGVLEDIMYYYKEAIERYGDVEGLEKPIDEK